MTESGVGKRGDDVGVAAFEVPEVVQVAVGEDDEAAILGPGVLARLLLADERIFVFGLGFKDDEREALCVEQQEIDEALCWSSRSCRRARPGRLI